MSAVPYGVVYGVFMALTDTPIYIGKTTDFRVRRYAHQTQANMGNPAPLYEVMRQGVCYLAPLVSCRNSDDLTRCEAILIDQWGTSRRRGGCNRASVPVRLDRSSSSKTPEEWLREWLTETSWAIGYEATVNEIWARNPEFFSRTLPGIFPSATTKPFPDIDEVAERERFEARFLEAA